MSPVDLDERGAAPSALRELARAVARWQAHACAEFPEAHGSASASIAQQLLYERWVARPRWRVRAEAVPLLMGVDPELWSTALAEPELAAAEAVLARELKAAVSDGRLAVAESKRGLDGWSTSPQELYRWTQSQRYRVPEALETLLQFVLKVVKRGDADRGPYTPVPGAGRRASARDGGAAESQVLGAALNVVTKWPDEVRDEHGFVDAEMIVTRLERSARVYFDAETLPLARADALALVERWLL